MRSLACEQRPGLPIPVPSNGEPLMLAIAIIVVPVHTDLAVIFSRQQSIDDLIVFKIRGSSERAVERTMCQAPADDVGRGSELPGHDF